MVWDKMTKGNSKNLWSNIKVCGERNKEKQQNMKEGKTRGGRVGQ